MKFKVNKYVLNSCITALILAILLVSFFIFLKVNSNKKVKKDEPKTEIKDQITISFDTDGGSAVKDIKINKNETIKLPISSKTGYEFDGWYLDNTKVSDKTKFIKDTKLKAKWIKKEEEVKTFKVTFDSKGGSQVSSIIVDCDTELKLPKNPTRDGYEFVSWVDKNDRPILDQALLACEDITLYANWQKKEEEIKTIKVFFYLDDAYTSEYASVNVECGENGKGLKLPQNNPTLDGYEFVSWVDKNGKSILDGTKFTCDSDVKLSPYWKKIEKKEEPKEEPKEEEKQEEKQEEEEKKDNN